MELVGGHPCVEFGILHLPVWDGFGGMHFERFWNCDGMGGRLAF